MVQIVLMLQFIQMQDNLDLSLLRQTCQGRPIIKKTKKKKQHTVCMFRCVFFFKLAFKWSRLWIKQTVFNNSSSYKWKKFQLLWTIQTVLCLHKFAHFPHFSLHVSTDPWSLWSVVADCFRLLCCKGKCTLKPVLLPWAESTFLLQIYVVHFFAFYFSVYSKWGTTAVCIIKWSSN